MFIFILNPISGPEGAKNQQEKNKVEDPESVLKPLFANSAEKPEQAGGIRPYDAPDKVGIEHTVIRAMERAAGQLFDGQADPGNEMLMKDLEQYTHEPITPERKQAFEQFFKLIRDKKSDVKSNKQDYFNSLITTWNLGKIAFRFTGLIDPQMESEELKKKGIEVLDGGVDPIAGAKITLKIHGKEYTASYSPVGGVNLDSLKSEDGTPTNPDVAKLVEENNQLITRVGMQLANQKSEIED